MRLSTKGTLAGGTVVGTIVLIGAIIWWANAEVEAASRQRRHVAEIARALNDQRMVTFEYILHREERARVQEESTWQRLQSLLAPSPAAADASEALTELREHSAATHRLFAELLADPPEPASGPDAAAWRFESQLTSRLLILQQQALVDAARLSDIATARINAAQQRVVLVIGAGLGVLLAIAAASGWLMRRDVLRPIARLEQATRDIAAGNWSVQLNASKDDEIGQLARHFDAMTSALRDSFGQVERSNRELTALNKEIEAFSYSVSHDLRGPLRSMDGFSLALLEDYADKLDTEGRDNLQRIRAASQRMGRLIDELLALSRVTRADINRVPVDLSATAQDIAAALAHQQPARDVQVEIEPGLKANADKALLQIALQNLLENAWKFTGKTPQAKVRVGRDTTGATPAFFVADNGSGFDMTYAGRLFGAFQRLHHESEFPGTGVGLATVQRVFRRHGGTVWAQAAPGQGATFFFTLGEHDDERREQGHPAG